MQTFARKVLPIAFGHCISKVGNGICWPLWVLTFQRTKWLPGQPPDAPESLCPGGLCLVSCPSHTLAHFPHNLTVAVSTPCAVGLEACRVVSARLGQSVNCGRCTGSSGKNASS